MAADMASTAQSEVIVARPVPSTHQAEGPGELAAVESAGEERE
jgi:hypothetical protein